MSTIKVFISYSHDSDEHRERVRGLGASLSRDGCNCQIDVYKDTDEDWPSWMTRQLLEADFILCVVTETYERRFRDKELPDRGLGVGWEAGMIRRLLYAKKLHNNRIFPVFFDKSEQARIPLELQGYDDFLLDSSQSYEALLRKVHKRPLYAKPDIGVTPELTTNATTPLFTRPGEATPITQTETKTDISRIVKYAPTELIGRADETALLNDAWAKAQSQAKPRPHIVTFVALGGEGKTSLVAKWAAELAANDWPGCEAVFAWSFYSQGTREQVAASSDLFLAEALRSFGDAEMAGSAQGAYEKGQRLARLVGERRALLILDGVEPLQHAPTAPTPGELRDQGLAALLKGLATNNRGLCVVTSRYAIPDLCAFVNKTVREENLLRLSCEAGVQLLQTLGVRKESGSQQEFEKLVEDVKGHALTLQLIGAYLKRAFQGDIRKRDRIKFEKADAKIQGGHAFRAMAAYVKWLEADSEEARRELALLSLMGLFDRPATADCLEALLRPPAIPHLTEPLMDLEEDDLWFSLTSLREAKLITFQGEATVIHHSPFRLPNSIDAHPLVREYFAKRMKEADGKMKEEGGMTQENSDSSLIPHLSSFKEAHRRLYEHLCATTKEGEAPTLEALQPLYQAVAHGCQAGLQQEACEKVYVERILRGTGSGGNYSTFKLGAFGSDLGAVACFFDAPFSRVSPVLTEADQAWLLNEAAFCLRALGRLTESIEPMRAGLENYVKQEGWKQAAIAASNLSELELTLGEVAAAVRDAEQSVEYADRSGDVFQRMSKRTTHADALHQAGRRAAAEACFQEAEQMQAEHQPGYPLLYSVQGFQYCDLRLAEAERGSAECGMRSAESSRADLLEACRAVTERATQTLKIAEQHLGLLDIALDHLTLGRAALYEAILSNSAFRIPHSAIESAVSGLRRSGYQYHLPLGLLTRAWLRALTGALTGPDSAQEDLDEAWEIATRGAMKLHLEDIHLYRARLFGLRIVEAYPWISPEHDLAEAERLIQECGYHRRDEELADAKRALLGTS